MKTSPKTVPSLPPIFLHRREEGEGIAVAVTVNRQRCSDHLTSETPTYPNPHLPRYSPVGRLHLGDVSKRFDDDVRSVAGRLADSVAGCVALTQKVAQGQGDVVLLTRRHVGHCQH